MKIPLLVFMSEIKITDTEIVKILFLLCFKIAIVQFNQVRQQSRQRHNFPTRFMPNLMLPACLLGVFLQTMFATEI